MINPITKIFLFFVVYTLSLGYPQTTKAADQTVFSSNTIFYSQLNAGSSGDVDCSKTITIDDAIQALKIMVRLKTGNTCRTADINGDGKISLPEIIFVLKSKITNTQ